MKEIQITFDIDGETKIKAIGFTGKSCIDATVFIEKELGQVTSKNKTPEYYQTTSNTHLKQRN